MNKGIRSLMILVLTLVILMSFTTMAFAAVVPSSLTADQISWLNNNVSVDNGRIVSTDPNVKGKLTLTSPGGSGTSIDYCQHTISGTTIYWEKSKDAALATSITRAINNENAAGKMQDLTNTLDVTADTAGAGVMLSGLAPIINIFLGIIATLIMFGMAISSSLDICYIAFPVFRNKAEDMKASGNSMMTKKSANGDVSLRWVTDDAQYAVSSTVTEGSSKSPWGVYFKKRVTAYIFLTIIMFILLTGNITLITDIALKIVSGILNVLQGLA